MGLEKCQQSDQGPKGKKGLQVKSWLRSICTKQHCFVDLYGVITAEFPFCLKEMETISRGFIQLVYIPWNSEMPQV
jgi:hypothetical protein